MNDKTYPPEVRKKPVVIEAWRIVPGSPQPSWVRDALAKHEGVTGAIDWDAAGEGMWINTLEGCMTANEGDWLIKGIKGELYACKPDIFEATYEAVDVDAAPAAQAEQHRPDVLERLTYHALERDDLTLEECLSFLADGWRKVHGRTERQMVMQILALLAGAPAQPAEVKAERVPADVVEAAQRIQANGYRAPLAWARKVFDWVASQEPTQPTEARAERAAALETNCAANAMLRTVNRMVEASSVGDDALVAMAEQIRAEAERMSREATGVLIRSKTKDATQSTSTTGGA